MNGNNDIANPDRDSGNRAYNAARAQWHSHRASISTDSSTKRLHEKFALLYRARAEVGNAVTDISSEF